jgi:hypothetical protein
MKMFQNSPVVHVSEIISIWLISRLRPFQHIESRIAAVFSRQGIAVERSANLRLSLEHVIHCSANSVHHVIQGAAVAGSAQGYSAGLAPEVWE